jgi:hypothetical protein
MVVERETRSAWMAKATDVDVGADASAYVDVGDDGALVEGMEHSIVAVPVWCWHCREESIVMATVRCAKSPLKLVQKGLRCFEAHQLVTISAESIHSYPRTYCQVPFATNPFDQL